MLRRTTSGVHNEAEIISAVAGSSNLEIQRIFGFLLKILNQKLWRVEKTPE